MEEASCALTISVYDTERNEKAKLHREELVSITLFPSFSLFKTVLLSLSSPMAAAWLMIVAIKVHKYTLRYTRLMTVRFILR